MAKNIRKYFIWRNYIDRFKWSGIFRNIQNSDVGEKTKIHNSAVIRNSQLGGHTTISENVTVNNCEIGYECKLLANSYFYNASLGDYSYVNMNSFVLRADIGKYCSIASHVHIGPGNHPMNFVTTHPFMFLRNFGHLIPSDDEKIVTQRERRSIIIGNDVWIGQGAIIMDNIKIGDGAIIGAHSVVTKDVEPFSIVVGNPAKKIRYRFSEEISDALKDIKWWDWKRSKIIENIDDFRRVEIFVKKFKK